MKLKITPEIEASMLETESRLDAAMEDPAFRAEHEGIISASLSESSDIVSGERTGNFRPVDQFLSDMHKLASTQTT